MLHLRRIPSNLCRLPRLHRYISPAQEHSHAARSRSSATSHGIVHCMAEAGLTPPPATAAANGTLSNKRKMVQIGTHSGTFHCDEALGCYMLKQIPKFRDAAIVRTRDPSMLNTLDVIIDVRGFGEVFGHGYNTKLSSAGLVYKHFGRGIVAGIMGMPEDHPDVETVWLQVYKNFIEAVDAIDNGVNQYSSKEPPMYINNTTLSARVGALNPKWNDESSDAVLDASFAKAVTLTGGEFLEAVQYVYKHWLPAKHIVRAAVQERHAVDASGCIIKLSQAAPWKEHLYNLEAELGVSEPILYCLYEDDREHKWRIQAVSKGPGSFENRKSLPAAWCGLRDEKLNEVSGIPGCVFVHANGFIGGNDTYEGALEMARRSVAEPAAV